MPESGTMPDLLPDVTLEVRHAGSRPTTYALSQLAFLIGTVPGCDLRLGGADLPPLALLLARHQGGLALRKLAIGLPLQINGLAAVATQLRDGDQLTLGSTEIVVRMRAGTVSAVPAADGERNRNQLQDAVTRFRDQLLRFQKEKEQFERARQASEKDLGERDQRLAEEYGQWQERRTQLDTELQRRDTQLKEQEASLAARLTEDQQRKQEVHSTREEVLDLRRQLTERYQERNDRLDRVQRDNEATRQRLAEREQQLTLVEQHHGRLQQQLDARQAEQERRTDQLAQIATRVEASRREVEDQLAAVKKDRAERLADLEQREQRLAVRQGELDTAVRQYEADVLRLDRQRGDLEQRVRQQREFAEVFDQERAQFQLKRAELEEQLLAVDEMRVRLAETDERLTQKDQEQNALASQLIQRAAMLEGQQASLAAMRTRLERMREDLRVREQALEEQHAQQQTEQQRLERERQELDQLRTELDGERSLSEAERRQFTERSAVLEAGVRQLRDAQTRLGEEEQRLTRRAAELENQAAQLAEHDALWQGRLAQITEAQERLEAERQSLRERSIGLTKAEQAREALQEQLRRRAEELAVRQKALDDQVEAHRGAVAEVEQRHGQVHNEHSETAQRLASLQTELTQQKTALDQQEAVLTEQQRAHRTQADQLAIELRAFEQEATRFRQEHQQASDRLSRERAEFETLRREASELLEQLPDVELRVGTGLDRLSHAREQLRDHLAEVHQYVRQCQDELEQLRGRVQGDVDRLEQEEQVLRQRQDEHRLAMVAFRQQLIEWQGQIGDMRRAIARGETRLDRREAQVVEKVKEIDATSERLARQAEVLEVQQREVIDRRHEMDRHLTDMREWYRKKLRDLAGIPLPEQGVGSRELAVGRESPEAGELPMARSEVPADVSDSEDEPLIPGSPGILTMASPVDAGDQALGATLRTLQLIDDDALTALLAEARRQRRSLRQVLLASGVVTLYQLALIEAGNLDGLMLGPVRVIDRVRQTPMETVYRVFDPRRGIEATLRYLAESAMADAVRPDEFRQRFGQAVLSDTHLAGTLEVLEIQGRPAALQPWLTGLPATDWPPLAAAPGVCYRLLTQAAHGLAAAHAAGLVHGHLSDALLLLNGEGVLKICGLGEPPWLTNQQEEDADPRSDLRALGAIVSGWCTPSGVRRGARAKPLPEPLVSVLYRLNADGENAYPSTTELLGDLEKAAGSIPPNAEAWERLLRYVREHATPDAALRRSA
jgi:DNA repair exonuclease SbcCD ATPase subunit